MSGTMDANANIHKSGNVAPMGHPTSGVTDRKIEHDGHLIQPNRIDASQVAQDATGLSESQKALLKSHTMGEGGGNGCC
jgi:hypothetical protein